MGDPLDILDDEQREKLAKKSQPAWTQPMLATLTDDHFSDPDWIYERKLDGVRCLAFAKNGRVKLRSRNKNDLNAAFPELVDVLEKQGKRDFIADGEIVAFEGNRTSFSRLQGRIGVTDARKARRSRVAVHLYLFDLLHLDGYDVTNLALRTRKQLLRRSLRFRDPLRFTQHRNECGVELLEEACRKGWEGLIAKRADGAYVHKRSRDWLKFKCVNRQELVIGGYTEPHGSRTGFGALLVGYYEDGRLCYAGKVGTGYDEQMLRELSRRLQSMQRKSCPFAEEPREKGAHWVSPRLVGEVGFTEWTQDGKLRHPRFLGLRTDKSPKKVRRERPQS